MANSTLPVPPRLPAEFLWLRLARVAASCSFALFLIAVIVIALLNVREGGLWVLVPVPFSALFWLPYLGILAQLRCKDAQSRKKGLALALAYGAWALVLAAVFALAFSGWMLQGLFGIFVLLQLALIVSAIKSYRSMERNPDDLDILSSRILTVSACMGILCLAAVLIPHMMRSTLAANEASCVSTLRTIYIAQSSYAEKYPQKGFASTLSELGPSPGAGLIDQQLASGIKSGYRFTFIAAPPDATGHIAHYTIVGRPLTYETTGVRSFFVDDSFVIRATAADRAPTAQDPPL
jgi:hypothetical protein